MQKRQIWSHVGIVLLCASVCTGTYLINDYFMDDDWPKAFGQACGKSIQDDCLYLNSHLNSLGILNYGDDIDCVVQLDAGKQKDARYKLQFKRFDIEYERRNCSYDYLTIFDNSTDGIGNSGSLIGKYCGDTAPGIDNETITQRYVTLKFHTDGGTGKKGFRILATRTLPYPCKKGYFHCKGENRCIDDRLQCDGTVQCDDATDEDGCSFWEKLIGGLFALGVSGMVGVGCLVVFGCTSICVTVCCCTCCKHRCKCLVKACKKCKEERQRSSNKVDAEDGAEIQTFKSPNIPAPSVTPSTQPPVPANPTIVGVARSKAVPQPSVPAKPTIVAVDPSEAD